PDEVFFAQLGRQRAERAFPVETGTRLRDSRVTAVARVNLDGEPIEPAGFVQYDRNRERFLARGAWDAPDSQRLAAVCPKQLRHDGRRQAQKLIALSPEIRFLDGE